MGNYITAFVAFCLGITLIYVGVKLWFAGAKKEQQSKLSSAYFDIKTGMWLLGIHSAQIWVDATLVNGDAGGIFIVVNERLRNMVSKKEFTRVMRKMFGERLKHITVGFSSTVDESKEYIEVNLLRYENINDLPVMLKEVSQAV